MKPSLRSALVTIVLAMIAGAGGVWIGKTVFREPPRLSLHELIHKELAITPAQDREIEALETAFAARREALEREMRAANAELATAIKEEQGYGPRVTAAVEHFHEPMGRMQSETIAHVFAMREVLAPEQRTRFDDKVVAALTAEER